jgi:predicted Zn finger-like uncharacterized protein
MQVTCPNCGARYAVDPLAIGPVGRIVQCARCANRWLQTVAAAAAQAAARQAVDAAMSSPQTAPGSGAVTVDMPPGSNSGSTAPPFGEPSPPSGPILGAARPFAEIDPVPDLVIRPPRQRTSLPAVIEPRRKSSLPVLIGAGVGMVVVIVAIGAALYFFREPILAKMPAEWRAFLHL